MGWVFRHSPFTGVTFAVHLAIADSVNDQNDNEFWMAQGNLAQKARVSRRSAQRAVDELIEKGHLVLLEDNSKAGTPNRYRFEGVRHHDAPGASPATQGVRHHDAQTQEITQENPKSRDQVAQWFDEWYSIYPRKKARQAALKAYRSCLKSQRDSRGEPVSLEQARGKLLTRVKRFEILSRGRDAQFLPYPASWLNGGCYDDEDLLPNRWNGDHPLRSTNGQYDTERPVYA